MYCNVFNKSITCWQGSVTASSILVITSALLCFKRGKPTEVDGEPGALSVQGKAQKAPLGLARKGQNVQKGFASCKNTHTYTHRVTPSSRMRTPQRWRDCVGLILPSAAPGMQKLGRNDHSRFLGNAYPRNQPVVMGAASGPSCPVLSRGILQSSVFPLAPEPDNLLLH